MVGTHLGVLCMLVSDAWHKQGCRVQTQQQRCRPLGASLPMCGQRGLPGAAHLCCSVCALRCCVGDGPLPAGIGCLQTNLCTAVDVAAATCKGYNHLLLHLHTLYPPCSAPQAAAQELVQVHAAHHRHYTPPTPANSLAVGGDAAFPHTTGVTRGSLTSGAGATGITRGTHMGRTISGTSSSSSSSSGASGHARGHPVTTAGDTSTGTGRRGAFGAIRDMVSGGTSTGVTSGTTGVTERHSEVAGAGYERQEGRRFEGEEGRGPGLLQKAKEVMVDKPVAAVQVGPTARFSRETYTQL